jgi:hypothetical protein
LRRRQQLYPPWSQLKDSPARDDNDDNNDYNADTDNIDDQVFIFTQTYTYIYIIEYESTSNKVQSWSLNNLYNLIITSLHSA